MMGDRPDGARLLELAQETLMRELATQLPEDQRQEIALIARAMTIAARELDAARAPPAICHAALAQLYGEGDADSLMRRLAREIRAGAHDAPGPKRDEVRSLLWAMTREKLRVSNPEYLAGGDADQSSQKTWA
jgi:uncharacterized protein DUF6285